MTKVTEKLNEMSDEEVRQVVKIAAMVAAIGPLLLIFSKVVGAVSTALKAFNLFRSGMVAVATGIKKRWRWQVAAFWSWEHKLEG